MKKKKLASKGEVVLCPGCNDPIGTLLEDLYAGDPLLAKQFEGIQQVLVPGDKMFCLNCGTEWFRNGGVHLERGWTTETYH